MMHTIDVKNIMWRNGKGYVVCPLCKSLVQINKKFFGSAHFCIGENK
mgnify:CR=1 FL=1